MTPYKSIQYALGGSAIARQCGYEHDGCYYVLIDYGHGHTLIDSYGTGNLHDTQLHTLFNILDIEMCPKFKDHLWHCQIIAREKRKSQIMACAKHKISILWWGFYILVSLGFYI